jgi:flavin-dependent dehydrogenase
MYPVSRKEIEFGMALRLKFGEKAKLEIIKMGFFENFDGKIKNESTAVIGYPVKRVAKGNYLLLGDSAGMVHPVYGMGIHYIDRISDACADCIKTGEPERYQKFWNYMLRKGASLWARGMATWSLTPEDQEKLVKIQKYMEISPYSIYADLLGLDTKIEILAKRKAPLKEFPKKYLLWLFYYRMLSMKFYI